MKCMILVASAALVFGTRICAQEDDSLAGPELGQPGHYEMMKEAEWDWQPGDLIFRNGVNEIDETVKRALGLRWASVGILRASSGGPRVVYAHQERGVYEDMLFDYVEGLSSDDYVVYRLSGVDPGYDPQDQMGSGPLVRLALSPATRPRQPWS